jgi:hypothetical protein
VPFARIAVGVLVERRKAASPWVEFTWRAVDVLVGEPSAAPWTLLASSEDATTFYAGASAIELHRSETGNYRDNLQSAAPALWVALRPQDGEPPYAVVAVTADPAEGEGLTGAGDDLVDVVPMPEGIRQLLEAFVAEHHVERPYFKRERSSSREP